MPDGLRGSGGQEAVITFLVLLEYHWTLIGDCLHTCLIENQKPLSESHINNDRQVVLQILIDSGKMMQGGAKVATLELAIQDGRVVQSFGLLDSQGEGLDLEVANNRTVGPAVKGGPD